MVVDTTVYRDEGGVRKQLTMDGWAAQALTTAEHLTKGVVAHECLLLANDEYDDELSTVEDRVFADHRDIVDALDEMVSSLVGAAEDRLANECDYDDPYERVDADIYLTQSLDVDLPARYVGDLIAESVAYVDASPWRSRYDRLADVSDLGTYRETGDVPDDASMFVQQVIDGESPRWDVADLHVLVSGEWWEGDVSMDDMSRRSTEISRTKAARLPAARSALTSYIANTDELSHTVPHKAAKAYLEDWYPDYGPETIRTYLDELVDDGIVAEPEDDGGPSGPGFEI